MIQPLRCFLGQNAFPLGGPWATPSEQLLVTSLLKYTQMDIDTAANGDEAIEMCRKKAYHVILLDHMMPGKDGIETMRANSHNFNFLAAPTIKVGFKIGKSIKQVGIDQEGESITGRDHCWTITAAYLF